MKKFKNNLRRIMSMGLTVALLANSFPAVSIAAEPDGDEPAVVTEAAEYPVFEQSAFADGVKITVTADEGVFPEGARLFADKLTKAKEEAAQEAVESERDEDQNVAVSYTFDIKVLDQEGKEIEPADQSKVKLSFTLDEVADENLSTNVYHISENTDNSDARNTVNGSGDTAAQDGDAAELTAEKLQVKTKGNTATAETDGFSFYTVEFTYNDLQYVMPGDNSIALSEILNKVGLTGEVSDVEVSDESLFSAEKEDGEWLVTAYQAFSTDEWMKVTINGVVYEIVVTDTQTITYIDEKGVEKACTEYTVLDGTESALSAGWYVVNSTINYTHTITGSGKLVWKCSSLMTYIPSCRQLLSLQH